MDKGTGAPPPPGPRARQAGRPHLEFIAAASRKGRRGGRGEWGGQGGASPRPPLRLVPSPGTRPSRRAAPAPAEAVPGTPMPKPLRPGQGPGPPRQVSMRGQGRNERRARSSRVPGSEPRRGVRGARPGSGARTRRRAAPAARRRGGRAPSARLQAPPTGSAAHPRLRLPGGRKLAPRRRNPSPFDRSLGGRTACRGVWGVRRRWVGRPSWLTPVEQKVRRAAELPSRGAGPLQRAVGSSARLARCLSFLKSSSVPPRGPGFVLAEKGTGLGGSGASSSPLGPGDGAWGQTRVARAPLGPGPSRASEPRPLPRHELTHRGFPPPPQTLL